MTEWLIAVTLCFLNLPNAPAPMCMPAYVPLTFQEEEKCEVAKINFINYFDPIAREKELSMIFKCVPMPSGQVPLPQLQENFYEGYTAIVILASLSSPFSIIFFLSFLINIRHLL